MSFLVDHLKERHVDLRRTRVLIAENQAYFLCFNLLGQLIGYQKYNPLGEKAHHNIPKLSKYFTCISEDHRYAQAWGLETLSYRDDLLFITEGVFDAVRLHNLDLPAVAAFTSTPPDSLRHYLSMLGRRLIGILDADEAGTRMASFCDDHYVVPAPHKDLGDMPEKAVKEFIGSITYL